MKYTTHTRPAGVARSLALGAAVLACAATHCSLTASPGDYTSELRTPKNAATPSHVIVVAGERDRLTSNEVQDVATADVWTARIRSDGRIAGWSIVPSAPLLSNVGATLVANGNFYVVAPEVAAGYRNHVGASWIPLTDDGVGPSWNIAFAEIPTYVNQAALLLPAGLVSVGGSSFGADGVKYYGDVWFSAFNEPSKAFAPTLDTGVKLVKARSGATTLAYKNFIYVLGGDTPDTTRTSSVEVSVLGEKGLSPFVETTAVQIPGEQQPYRVQEVTACAAEGSLYVIGGAPTSAPLDVVLMARIDEGNGTLSAWKSVTKLPGGRAEAGCFTAHGRLYVLGGRGTTERSTSVLSAPILSEGLLGDWDGQSHAPLPAGRSQIAVAAY